MSVNIHISGETAAEALKELFDLGAGFAGVKAAPVVKTEEAPKTSRATRKVEKAIEPEVTPEPVQEDPGPTDEDAPTTEPETEEEGAPSDYTVEDLRAKAAEAAKLKKQAGIKSILTGIGAASISAVPDGQRNEVYAALQALIDG